MSDCLLPGGVFTPDDDSEPTSLRDAGSRSKKSEMTIVWVVAILAISAIGFAVQLAYREPVPPAPAPANIVAELEPETPKAPPIRKVSPPAPKRSPVTSRPASAPTAPVVIQEPEPKTPVDPVAGFDTGEAFDNPPSPGQYGRRSSGIVPGEVNRRPR